ncbi:MAG: CPCC family cysteine-rich protein [Anaerolineales bacterium]
MCPCCKFSTFDKEPSVTFEECSICHWVDDDTWYKDELFVSLFEAQKIFHRFITSQVRKTATRNRYKDEILEMLTRVSGTVVNIETELTLISPENGGRKKPFFCGMRPKFHYDDKDWKCTLQILTSVSAYGQNIIANFGFDNPSMHVGKLFPGKEFTLRYGYNSSIIAQGRVTKTW